MTSVLLEIIADAIDENVDIDDLRVEESLYRKEIFIDLEGKTFKLALTEE